MFVGLLLGTMAAGHSRPGPELEYEWEEGTAGTVSDGDTLDVKIATSNSGSRGSQRVRTIGVQAPEVPTTHRPQCGSAQAKDRPQALPRRGPRPAARPEGDVQRRLLGWPDRPLRSMPRTRRATGTTPPRHRERRADDVVPPGRRSDKKPEWAHNLEYRVLADDAPPQPVAAGSGRRTSAAPRRRANLRMSVSWDQDSSVNGYETVFIENDGADVVDLSGWTLRDSALNKYTFPGYAAVPAGRSIEIRLTGRGRSRLRHLLHRRWPLVRQPAREQHLVRRAMWPT